MATCKTEVNCQPRGFDSLTGVILQDRYKVVKKLSQGSFGHTYMIEDIKSQKILAVKLQDNFKMATREIATLKNLQQVFEANRDDDEFCYSPFPKLFDWGILNLTNFGNDAPDKSISYFTMPLYEMELG